MTTYINGQAYDSANVAVRFADMDEPFYGFKSIDYSEEEEIEMNYGFGQRAVSYGRGNITTDISLTISYDSFQSQLVDRAPGGRVQDLPMVDLIVTYNNPNADKIKTDVIKKALIASFSPSVSQNDKEFEVELKIVSPEVAIGVSGV